MISIRIIGSSGGAHDRKVKLLADARDMTVLGVHDSGHSALKAMVLIVTLPDVILIDMNLSSMSGTECLCLLKNKHPALRILVCTPKEDGEEMIRCIRAGASGYVLKGMMPANLLRSIRDIHAGGTPMSALMTRTLVDFVSHTLPLKAVTSGLSQREQTVLGMLARGLRYKEIAEEMAVGIATVRTYLERAYGKLGVTNRSEAVARFLEHSR